MVEITGSTVTGSSTIPGGGIVTGAAVLARWAVHLDGIVLVVRADVTTQQEVEACLEMLDQRNVIGTVLNGARIDRGRYGYVS